MPSFESPETRVELLTPDFLGKRAALETVWASRPDVFGHNVECVANLYRYLQSQQGGRRGRRWLLKNESLLGFLDGFLVVHPNVTLMHIHRDPRVSIPSLLKLGTEFSRPLLR